MTRGAMHWLDETGAGWFILVQKRSWTRETTYKWYMDASPSKVKYIA